MRPLLLLAALFVLPSLPGAAAPRAIRLAPPSATMGMRAYAGGLLPLDSRFTRFEGTLTYDPADPLRCAASVTADVVSLQAATPAGRGIILGPDFLDAAHYATLAFTGNCTPTGMLEGRLTLHGVTRPLALRLDWSAHSLSAEGDARRALWGIDAHPLMVGPTVRIHVTTSLP